MLVSAWPMDMPVGDLFFCGPQEFKTVEFQPIKNTELQARDIVERSLAIAADICIYTNNEHTIETISS